MITMKHCRQCSKDFDSVLPTCPHCLTENSPKREDELRLNSTESADMSAGSPDKIVFPLTPSGNGVQVDASTAKLHPLFGVKGSLLYFRMILLASPLLGLFFSAIQSPVLLNSNYFALIYCCILDSFIFVWAYWLSKEFYKYERQTVDKITKFLIITCAL